MARARLAGLPGPLAVFLGGATGGAIRLGIDALVPPIGAGVPLDIVAINIVGAFLLGVMSAWVAHHGHRPWVPLVGTGALGAFTTFSALAVLPSMTSASAAVAVVVVVVTLGGAIGAAALGWGVGDRLARALPRDARSPQ